MSRIFAHQYGTWGDISPVPHRCILNGIARKKTVLINNEALRRLLEEKEIKQWWLARRIGVDRKTVTRWISGTTQRVSQENLERLAEEIGCSPDELIVQDSLEALGTRKDRWEAARQLQHSNLTEMVGPSYSWELAESLIRSTIDPEMPLDLQAALYMQLASCGIYSHKHELVRTSAEIALRKATEAGEESLAHRARTMLGNEALMIGELKRAISFYEEALRQRELFSSPAKLAGTLSNLAVAFSLRADFEEALETFAEAVSVWEMTEPVISMSTAWYLKARLHTELQMRDDARQAIQRCREVCSKIGFRKNANMCIGLEADLASQKGEHEEATRLAREAMKALEQTPNVSPEAHESIVRVLRCAGHIEESGRMLEEMMSQKIDDSYSVARLNLEKARHLMIAGDEEAATGHVQKANELFLALGAPKRVLKGLPSLDYKQVSRP